MINCIIVDDEPHSIELLEYYAQSIPELKIIAGCLKPLKAIEILRNDGIDLVFLDMQMPEMSGFELIQAAKTNAKVIITSAYPNHDTRQFGDAFIDYLLKPFTIEELKEAIKKVKLD
jgi:two-component system, LytTR family, response regulator